jgi:hypothetical protein
MVPHPHSWQLRSLRRRSWLVPGVLLLFGVASSEVRLARAWDNPVPGSRYQSVRALSMGNAFIEMADDASASLFYNPAGIGKIRGFQLEPFNLGIQGDPGFLSSISLQTLQFPSFSNYKSAIENNPGVRQGASMSVAPAIAFRGFALGLLFQQSASAIFNSDSTFSIRGNREIVPAAGFGLRLASGVIRVGYSAQYVSKTEGEDTGVSSATTRDWHDGFAQGAGLSHNAAIAFTLPVSFAPSFNFVARNIGGLTFNQAPLLSLAGGSAGAPSAVPASYDAAYGMHFKLTNGGAIHVAAEYRDLLGASGMPILSKVALGVEADLNGKFQLRGGLNAGYISYGLGYRTRRHALHIGYFIDERGTGFWADGDPRWMLQWEGRIF